ncbi:MAG: hypothetical protein WCP89_00100 [archaeon]
MVATIWIKMGNYYIVRGDEEVYTAQGDLESESMLPYVIIEAGSINEAYELGRRRLQKIICGSHELSQERKTRVARVDLVFDSNGIKILYQSDKIEKQREARKNEKFDLAGAVMAGCIIDESGYSSGGGVR